MSDGSLYRFYAADVSYFSAKVRPALRYKGLHYAELLSTPENMRDVILAKTGLTFIPVLITPEGEAIQDTSVILDYLEERHPIPPLDPLTAVQRVAARIIELYADEFMVLPSMHYRWGTAEGETKARGDFASLSGSVELSNRFADRMSGSLPALGVGSDTADVIEAHLLDLLDAMCAHLGEQAYLLGGAPSLGDCAMMGPFYAHLFLDAVPGRLLRERAIPVCHWIQRMNHPDPDAAGAWLPGDALPATLTPILRLIGGDAVPVILDTLREFEAWADELPVDTDEPPRVVGFHESGFRGVRFQRYTSSYTLWMVQRTLDAYRALDVEEQARVDTALEGTGCEALLACVPRHRLGKRANKLVIAESFEG